MKEILVNDGISDVIFMALQNDQYDAGDSDFTPSSLNEPVYKRKLEAITADVKVNASTKIPAFLGSSVHYMMQIAAETNPERYEAERRYYGIVDTKHGPKKIGAQVDILDIWEKKITDGKVTKTYSVRDGLKADYIQQLNVQRWCVFHETGMLVDVMEIAGFWKDWTEHGSGQNYPKLMQTPVPVPIWPLEETEKWIIDRVEAHLGAKELDISEVETCSPSDRWKRDDEVAVIKKGGKRATKVFKSKNATQEAIEWVGSNADYVIENRIGADVRCDPKWCPACAGCSYYKSKQNNEIK